MEIWIRPSGQAATPSSQRGGSESSRDSEQDGELSSLSASDVRALFSLLPSFLCLICLCMKNIPSVYIFLERFIEIFFPHSQGN